MSESAATEMTTLEIWKGVDSELRVGGLRIVACRREVDTIDGGVTLYVWDDPSAGSPQELLRMDLFRERPHYHAPADEREETPIDAGPAGSVAWGIAAITGRAKALLAEGGFETLAETLDVGALAGAGPAIQTLLDELEEPTERSTFDVPAKLLAGLGR